MFFLKINGTELPTPTYYSVSSNDIDSSDSARSDETGYTHRRRIRSNVKTCDVKWCLNGADAYTLLSALSDTTLSVTLLDPLGNGYKTCEMYATNKKSSFYQAQNSSESDSYWEIGCRLTEY